MPMHEPRRWAHSLSKPRSILPMLLVSAACTGTIEGGEPGEAANTGAGGSGAPGTPNGPGTAGISSVAGSPGAPVDCAAPSPGTAPLRRLSNAEYRNTLNDLFAGVPNIAATVASATSELPAETESLGFRNNAEFLTVPPLVLQKYMDAAEVIAERAAAAAEDAKLVPCTPSVGAEMECARAFVQEFGARAYRRPLTAEEATRLSAQFQSALSTYDFQTGVEWVIFSVLQSPSFLYRVEMVEGAGAGGSGTGGGQLGRPNANEMASRLSYLFWQSLPDTELLRAGEAGELSTPEGVERAARRLLADARSERLFQYFAEWLDLDRLDDFGRDPAVFPGLVGNLPELLQEETRTFVRAVLSVPSGNFGELLTAPYTYANRTLAEHYGLSGATSDVFVKVNAPARSGVLTQAMLMVHDKPYRTSIVRRGLKVRTDLLCQNVPAPPNDVPLSLDGVETGLSQRERLEQHRADPSCAGCHALLDPVGLVFESFDAVGRVRSEDEAGKPIDTRTVISATQDANGEVTNARELGALLAASAEARECYVTQSFRFFFGRDVEPADACSMQRLNRTFSEKGFNLAELLVALTQSDAFLYRARNQEETQ